MPAYFEQNRFATVSETLVETVPAGPAAPHDIPYQIGSKGAVEAAFADRGQTLARYGADGLGLIERAVEGWVDFRRNEATLRVVNSIADSLPAGKTYEIAISNPNGYGDGGSEQVSVYEGSPQLLVSENNRPVIRTVVGRNTGQASATQATYTGTDDKPVTVEITPSYSPAPRPAPQRQPNAVDREPHGGFRERREVPADSRFDRDHPLFRDTSHLA